ncbi:MAG: hypothetical protein JNK72_01540 [Myxococcales bacterium]|nr:hypothetical protein [Myxococcales bacterium]
MRDLGLGLAVAAVAALASRPLAADLNRRYETAPTVVDEARIPRPAVAQALSLGHTEWAADVLWINAQIYYGEGLLGRLPGRFSRVYGEAIVGLDPTFAQGYLWGALALTMRATEVPVDDIAAAVDFLRRGHRARPTDLELQGQLGYVLAYEYAPRFPRESAAFREHRGEGGAELASAFLAGWGPSWLGLSAARALVMGGRRAEALGVLRASLGRVEEPELQARIAAEIAELSRTAPGDDPLVEVNRQIERGRREEYPYMPPTLYLFVGPRADIIRGGGFEGRPSRQPRS